MEHHIFPTPSYIVNQDGLVLYATIAIIAIIVFFGCYCIWSNCDTSNDSLRDVFVDNAAKEKKPSGA